MRTLLLSFVPPLTMALLLAGCSARSSDQQGDAVGDEEPAVRDLTISHQTMNDLDINVSSVEMKTIQGSLVVPARLIPNQDREAIVGSLVQGRVHRVLVNAGDQVRKGQELMTIEGLEIGEIKAQYIKAKAELRAAEANAKRQRLLREENVGSEKTFLQAEAEYHKALAEFTAEDRKIHSIGLSDTDVEQFVEAGNEGVSSHVGGVLPIRAPLSGVVAERNVVQGQLIDPTTNAFRIVDTGVLWADGQLHERDLLHTIGGEWSP